MGQRSPASGVIFLESCVGMSLARFLPARCVSPALSAPAAAMELDSPAHPKKKKKMVNDYFHVNRPNSKLRILIYASNYLKTHVMTHTRFFFLFFFTESILHAVTSHKSINRTYVFMKLLGYNRLPLKETSSKSNKSHHHCTVRA